MIIPENNDPFTEPPPPYQAHMHDPDEDAPHQPLRSQDGALDYSTYEASGKGLASSANIAQDGRINVSMHFKQTLPDLPTGYAIPVREFAVDPNLAISTSLHEGDRVPRMSIVIMIVGSRGDVQPFLALGLELIKYGHRVRIATHGTFRSFVKDMGVEFYDIGGDPHDLMSYMVKNPGLMPGWTSLVNGDIPRKQKMLSDILDGCWNACSQPDIDGKPFIADAIISNPPAFAHIHCAEALGIPLQLSFTMPWSPTTAFPQPLVNISQSNAEPGLTNYLTYGLAEMMTWQGLGGVINEFRSTRLGLEPLTVRSGPGVIDRLKVPWTYCFSPEIVPKPDDWQNHIDVVGFYFLNLASNYTPPADLAAFLDAGPPPIYIGFGSVVVENPEEMTEVIFQATEKAGVRALVSAGWGGLGKTRVPPHIFILGNVPHDWLFTKVFAVCHHGGAGTTAIGLQLGKPTIIVPFFGDQPFWGAMVQRSGAGPKPIKHEKLDVNRLGRSIEYCKTREAKEAAEELGRKIRAQNGVKNGVDSFHQHLPLLNMRCDILPNELAVWWSDEHCLKLSALAAQVLDEEKLINIHKLEIHRPKEYDTRPKTSDPVTGGVVESLRMITTLSESIAQIFTNPAKGLINTTTTLPRTVWRVLDSFTDGMTNTPALYGSAVRQPGRMKNFQTGMKEGGKAFFFGLSDGLTGLWTEPAEGYKTGGWKGLASGTMRSYANLAIRPAAGAISLVTYPVRGAMMSLYRQDNSVERHLRQLRVEQGKEAASTQPNVASPTAASSLKEDIDLDEDIEMDSKKKSKKKHFRIRRREESFEKHLRSLHNVTPEQLALADARMRGKILDSFKVACRRENLKTRKKAMQKRIQWIITKGGVGSVAEVTKKEELYFASAQITAGRKLHKAPPVPPKDLVIPSVSTSTSPLASPSTSTSLLTPMSARRSTSSAGRPSHQYSHSSEVVWTEEDELLFSKRLDEATRASLQTYNAENLSTGSTSGSTQKANEGAAVLGTEPSSSQVPPGYATQLLEAAEIWTNQTHEMDTEHVKGKEKP